ncbi:hypothetical protein CONCODRAFT_2087 [Conidiobolus coronatus NRRL 28638]|uniref:Uncharacterized protein n=1 Tax=Conidiobolus coronatus (strain ATCC 28846 / CBS 209.66 / NRRL 28638) TaxID=796925 RepID=A0A137PIH3_CONC2|nr:hypothetical protein CONCODRAFT_2087 [Conidiobolus coronatus NRRL 28638]|eukprot:KXN74770.1 hypothetical protein CONCODRAFT_2087 [Conidiobolus coronatus NRRL 28638]
MTTSTLSYDQFLHTIEDSDSLDCIEKMAFISHIRRKEPNVLIHSVDSIISSSCSTVSNMSTTPSTINIDTALYQKGFEIRRYDSDKEFDLIIEQGFQSGVGESMPTLKLTLTPNLLRR